MASKSATFIIIIGLEAGLLATASCFLLLISPASEKENRIDEKVWRGTGARADGFWPWT